MTFVRRNSVKSIGTNGLLLNRITNIFVPLVCGFLNKPVCDIGKLISLDFN